MLNKKFKGFIILFFHYLLLFFDPVQCQNGSLFLEIIHARMSKNTNRFLFFNDTSKLPAYVGNGYDLFMGNPKADKVDPGFRASLFDIRYNQSLKTEDLQFLIPDFMQSRLRFSCLYTSSVSEYTGTQKYQADLKKLVTLSGEQKKLDASFSASSDFKFIQESTSKTSSFFTQSTARCEAYSLEMPIFDYLPLNSYFITAVSEAKTSDDWLKVIEVYGTHFVYRTILGGRMHLQNLISNRNYQELKILNVDIKAAAKLDFDKFTGSLDSEVTYDLSDLKQFEKRVDDKKEIYLGGKPPLTGDWKDWYNFALDYPAPIEYSIKSIGDLFLNPKLFKNATLVQLSSMRTNFLNAVSDYCKQIGCIVPSSDPTLPYGMTNLFSISETYGVIMHGGVIVSNLNELKSNLKPLYTVQKVLIRCDQYIRSIQFLLGDEKSTFLTKIIGPDTKSNTEEWNVPDEDYITQIEIFTGDNVDSLRFITNKGTMSKKFGGNGGTYNQINLRGQLVGAQASYSGDRLLRLAFITSLVKYYDSRENFCPSGWEYNSGSCYLKSNIAMNFTESLKFCNSFNSTSLININSDAELAFIYTVFLDNYSEFWIGATADAPLNFRNLDKSKLILRWCDGEPNNSQGSSNNLVEACGLYMYCGLNDEQCSLRKPFICEMQV